MYCMQSTHVGLVLMHIAYGCSFTMTYFCLHFVPKCLLYHLDNLMRDDKCSNLIVCRVHEGSL